MLNLSYIEAPEILLVVFGGVHVAEALVSCVMFYILLFAFSSFGHSIISISMYVLV
jgi:hypothetical protein